MLAFIMSCIVISLKASLGAFIIGIIFYSVFILLGVLLNTISG